MFDFIKLLLFQYLWTIIGKWTLVLFYTITCIWGLYNNSKQFYIQNLNNLLFMYGIIRRSVNHLKNSLFKNEIKFFIKIKKRFEFSSVCRFPMCETYVKWHIQKRCFNSFIIISIVLNIIVSKGILIHNYNLKWLEKRKNIKK